MRHLWKLLLIGSLATGCAEEDDSPPDDDVDLEDAAVDAATGELPDDASSRADAGALSDASSSSTRDAQSAQDASRDAQSGRDAQSSRDAESPSDADVAPGMSGPSSGCGKAVSDPAGKFTMHSVKVGDTERTYQVYVPEGYQPSRRYPVVFRFHGTGGDGLSGGLDVQSVAPKDVIVVSPDGTRSRSNERTWTASAAEIELFDALVKAASESYCIDLGKMYAYGFSAGAGLTETLACVRGNTLRGIGAIAGYDWTRGRACEGQVAAWLVHDANDQPAPIAGGRAARDRLLQQNGCSKETEPAGTSCVRYLDCAPGHPVVWCETQGMGHNIRGDYAPGEVWKFFSNLP